MSENLKSEALRITKQIQITKILITSLCSLLLAISSFAQSAKEPKKEREKITKQGIKTMTKMYHRLEQSGCEFVEYEKTVFKYDKKGNTIEEALYDANEKLTYKHTYKYDDNGNKIETAVQDADGKIKDKNTYKHKYDERGNMIEQTVYRIKDGKEIPQSQTVYEYSFYEESKDAGKNKGLILPTNNELANYEYV